MKRPIMIPALLVLTALIGLSSCATLSGAGNTAVSALIDCGKPALQGAVADIAPTVDTILSGGSVNWQAELDEYKAKGLEVLACAVAKVGIALAAGTAKPLAAAAIVTPPDRAAYYLFSRDLHPVHVVR